MGGRALSERNMRKACAGSRSPVAARGSRAQGPSASHHIRRHAGPRARHRLRRSSATCSVSAPSSLSAPQSTRSLANAKGLSLVIKHHPHRPLAHLRRKLVHRLARHDSETFGQRISVWKDGFRRLRRINALRSLEAINPSARFNKNRHLQSGGCNGRSRNYRLRH